RLPKLAFGFSGCLGNPHCARRSPPRSRRDAPGGWQWLPDEPLVHFGGRTSADGVLGFGHAPGQLCLARRFGHPGRGYSGTIGGLPTGHILRWSVVLGFVADVDRFDPGHLRTPDPVGRTGPGYPVAAVVFGQRSLPRHSADLFGRKWPNPPGLLAIRS